MILALFVIAALGAWALYGEQIMHTTRAMIDFLLPWGDS